ncbi:MAG: hypothetical protein NDJ94_03805 [Vicinamibacteria bacterium]|jgi:hypothetical protein|nr:hypothetical protein [Vicinamibacteria bacterium]
MSALLLLQVEAASPDGVVQGGWDYVVAAYAISAAVFFFYAVTVVVRLRRAKDVQ